MKKERTVKAKCRLAREDVKFLPYQSKWVADRSRIKLMEKSRQIGMSWATAADIVRQGCLDSAKLDTWVSSRDEIQARLFLQDCVKFADIYNAAAEALGEKFYKDELGKPYTSFDLKFANGTSIHSMSSNADAQAGKRGTRVLDEFALHPDPVKLYAIAYPGITWGGQMAIISTHRGANNFFNTLVQEARFGGNPKGISLHRVTLQDALEEGFLAKLQTALSPDDPRQDMDEAAYFDYVKSGCPDSDTFLQEYMCCPMDEASVFISSDLMQGCLYGLAEVWQTDLQNCAGDLYLGFDVARTSDKSVIWLCEKFAGTYFTRKVVVMQNETFRRQEEELYALLSLPKLRRAAIDQTGIGRQLAERAMERFGSTRVEGVTFTAGTKEAMAYPLRRLFEDKIIRIPDSAEIRADLRSVKKILSTGGNVRFDSARNENGHADRFWALALMLSAASKFGQSGVTAIKKSRARRNQRRFI